MLINNFSINSSYNIVADSFKLAPFSISANTNIKNGLINVNLSASLDPYNYIYITQEDGTSLEKKIDQYAWKGGSLGRITSATLAMSTNLNPKGRMSIPFLKFNFKIKDDISLGKKTIWKKERITLIRQFNLNL